MKWHIVKRSASNLAAKHAASQKTVDVIGSILRFDGQEQISTGGKKDTLTMNDNYYYG